MSGLGEPGVDLAFVARPRGVPSFWTHRRALREPPGPIPIRYMVHGQRPPSNGQLLRVDELRARYSAYFFAALPLLKPAMARHIVEQRGLRMLEDELFVGALDLLPDDDGQEAHEMHFSSFSDARYTFTVTFHARRAVRLRVDRDDDAADDRLHAAPAAVTSGVVGLLERLRHG
jgi:hypothetical protein